MPIAAAHQGDIVAEPWPAEILADAIASWMPVWRFASDRLEVERFRQAESDLVARTLEDLSCTDTSWIVVGQFEIPRLDAGVASGCLLLHS